MLMGAATAHVPISKPRVNDAFEAALQARFTRLRRFS